MKAIFILLIGMFIGLQVSFAGNEGKTEAPVTTTSLSGKVLDKITGETLAGVMVQLDGCDQQVFSDFDGCFSFDNLKPAEYKITVSLISYETGQMEVDLSKPAEKQLKVMLKNVN